MNTTAGELVTQLVEAGERVAFVHADPPWHYDTGSGARGAAEGHYATMTLLDIAGDVSRTQRLVGEDAYLALWCTWPILPEWHVASHGHLGAWRPLTGGSWHKSNGIGVGYHLRGDSEPLLVYAKGRPKPRRKDIRNAWSAPRQRHSIKPQLVLRQLLTLATEPGDLVLDLYAGEGAAMARACQDTGRRYVGAEVDPERITRACSALAQTAITFPTRRTP